jgi:hypothetical protein
VLLLYAVLPGYVNQPAYVLFAIARLLLIHLKLMSETRPTSRFIALGLAGALGASAFAAGCARQNTTPPAVQELQTTIGYDAHNLALFILGRRDSGVKVGQDKATPPASTRTISLAQGDMRISSGTVSLLVHSTQVNADGTHNLNTLDDVSVAEWGPSQGTYIEYRRDSAGQWTAQACLTSLNSPICQPNEASNVIISPIGQVAGPGHISGNTDGLGIMPKIDAIAQHIAELGPQDHFINFGLPGAG